MNTKTFIVGTIAGGITVFAVGTLIFLVPPLDQFYAYAMTSGAAAGVPREAPIIWAVFLGALSYGALVTLALHNNPGSTSVAVGVRTGALVGFLLWFTADLMLYGVSNVGNITSTLVDPLVELIPGAISGAVIVLVVRRLPRTGEAQMKRVPA
jgi:hypothetical protein